MKKGKKIPSLKETRPIRRSSPPSRKGKMVRTVKGGLCDLTVCEILEQMLQDLLVRMDNKVSSGPPSGGSSQRGMETPNGNPEKPRKRRLLRGGSV